MSTKPPGVTGDWFLVIFPEHKKHRSLGHLEFSAAEPRRALPILPAGNSLERSQGGRGAQPWVLHLSAPPMVASHIPDPFWQL